MRIRKTLLHIIDFIDTVNEQTGKYVCLAIIPLVVVVTLDVVLRYVFNRPLVWGWDVNIQLAGLLIVLGGGYTLLYGGHIGVDVAVTNLSPRARAIIELITFPLFFCAIGALLWHAVPVAINSVAIRETYPSYWSPPLYPFRIIVVIGILLLLLQGIAKFVRDLSIITHSRTRREP